MVGHTASTAGKQRGDTCAQLAFFLLFSPGGHGGIVHIQSGFSLLVRLPGNTFMDVSMALLLDSKAHQDGK